MILSPTAATLKINDGLGQKPSKIGRSIPIFDAKDGNTANSFRSAARRKNMLCRYNAHDRLSFSTVLPASIAVGGCRRQVSQLRLSAEFLPAGYRHLI